MVVAGSKATKVILAMLGVWVRVRGWGNMESGRRQHAVVIFNHVSFVSGRSMNRTAADRLACPHSHLLLPQKRWRCTALCSACRHGNRRHPFSAADGFQGRRDEGGGMV